MKFVVIFCFLLLGVVLGVPRRFHGYRGGYGGRGGYYGGRVRHYGKRSADADAAPVADARRYGYRGYGGYRGYRGGYRGYSHYGKRDAEPEPRHRYGGYRGGYCGYRGGYRGY